MAFDPKQHTTKLKGKDYLEVRWRLVWFRDVHPNGNIVTEPIVLSESTAIVKATVFNNDGQQIASGIATVRSADNQRMSWAGRDFEKAETAAIGRALAHAGYGTQFTGEDESDFLADSPVERTTQQPKEQVTDEIIMVGVKELAGTMAIIADGIKFWSRDVFRSLGYTVDVIEMIGAVGMHKLPDPIRVVYEIKIKNEGDKKYENRYPIRVQRVTTGQVVSMDELRKKVSA